ncbi:tail fiber domain-containing protein [Salipiger mucosus]|uniref:Conjugative transfer pilus-tip adhesin protein PilV in PFGI-1-like cluster n=1 Tax=Salipiger mucosus DSM 16094 TaxID=1123237 RepID=S9Q5X6_9RHOB|nr:tail fiber domain-containing protein [Salipiger mucosus]EPX76786.1 Conjugative transfer pilus-tip adhesin protein PilV in PFGI-1-like cluster [Salipiger mucosus DSM 16094]
MNFKTALQRRGERGLNLMEVGIALVAVTFIVMQIMSMLSDNARTLKSQSDAEKMTTITEASERYLSTYRSDLLAATGGGGTLAIPAGRQCAGCAQPSSPAGLPTIQDAGFLPDLFVDTNSNQQSHALLVKQTAGGDLEAVLTSYGGSTMSDENVGQVSALLGAAGGGVFNNDAIGATDEISGVHGGWGDDVSNWNASIDGTNVQPSPGTVQVSMGLADVVGVGASIDEDKFLHREDSSAPLNGMETDLHMDGDGTEHNIDGVNYIQAREVRATEVRAAAMIDTTTGTPHPDGETWEVNPTHGTFLNRLYAEQMNLDDTKYRNDKIVWGATGTIEGPTDFTDDITVQDVTADNVYATNSVQAASMSSTGDIAADGNIEVGTVTPSGTGNIFVENRGTFDQIYTNSLANVENLRVRGEIYGDISFGSGGATSVDFNFGGTTTYIDGAGIHTDGSVETSNLYFTSDRRLKTDIEDIDGDMISELRPRAFTWKDDGGSALGFIAQEVEEDFPELVRTDPETGIKSVKYTDLIAPLVAKSQSTEDALEALTERVEELEDANR